VIRSRDERSIRVEAEYPQLTIVVERGRETVARASLPYPRSGYGGHELLLSPDERYLALWLISGQSEVGYELFTFGPTLGHIGGLEYVMGEGFGPVFSPHEERLALAWATEPMLFVEEEDVDGDGLTRSETLVEWARVHVRELPAGAVRECVIRVRLPPGLPCEGNDDYYPEQLALTSDEVRFETGWGTSVRIPLPLPASVIATGPTTR
jgi:hypothetical protein